MPISDNARVLLEQPIFASLATIGPDGHPQVTVIWLHVEGDKVVFNTAEGEVTSDGADASIDELAQKYLGTDYPFRRDGEVRVKVLMNVNSEHWMG